MLIKNAASGLNKPKVIQWTLVGIAFTYFLLFIPINFLGADELSKIRIFSSIDAYAQIISLEQMMQCSGKNIKQIIGDFLLHNHAYGYPFFFFQQYRLFQ